MPNDHDADDEPRDSSLPQKMPGQEDCPDGYRPAKNRTQPGASRECVPIGPNIPLGGWKPAKPGFGERYPHSAREAFNALSRTVLGTDLI